MNFFDKDITIHMDQLPTCECGTWVATVKDLGIRELGVSQREAFRNASDKVIDLIDMSPVEEWENNNLTPEKYKDWQIKAYEQKI